jgi:phosphoribosylaminoimidazolecarboxamide formyltransferase/IMP cyclohydrolase
MGSVFLEVVIAPKFLPEAFDELSKKKNLRLIEWPNPHFNPIDIRSSLGGYLLQKDAEGAQNSQWTVVTEAQISDPTKVDLEFAWKVTKHVRSNAIVISKNEKVLGTGAGQMSRVDAVQIAIQKAGKENLSGAVLSSDAFFPFRDNIDLLKGLGISAIIQPGGSKQDSEVINACNEHGIAMVFTGVRHFKH